MSKYRQIKAIAHNFSHSFTSMMNWMGGEYVMDHLISLMSEKKVVEIKLDILSSTLEPEKINSVKLMYSVNHYCQQFFPDLLTSHGVPEKHIKQAVMTLHFSFSDISPYEEMSTSILIPYNCRTEITDDRGRVHVGEINSSELTNRDGYSST